MYAAWGGHMPVVDRLLERGADPSAAGEDGWTVLMSTAQGDHLLLVDRLPARGADPSAADEDGWTALSLPRREATCRLSRDCWSSALILGQR